MTFTYDIDADELIGLEFALAVYNAEAKAEHDRKEAAKPEQDRVAHEPVDAEGYLTMRVADVLADYAVQKINSEQGALIAKWQVADKAERAALKSAVEAIEVKNHNV